MEQYNKYLDDEIANLFFFKQPPSTVTLETPTLGEVYGPPIILTGLLFSLGFTLVMRKFGGQLKEFCFKRWFLSKDINQESVGWIVTRRLLDVYKTAVSILRWCSSKDECHVKGLEPPDRRRLLGSRCNTFSGIPPSTMILVGEELPGGRVKARRGQGGPAQDYRHSSRPELSGKTISSIVTKSQIDKRSKPTLLSKNLSQPPQSDGDTSPAAQCQVVTVHKQGTTASCDSFHSVRTMKGPKHSSPSLNMMKMVEGEQDQPSVVSVNEGHQSLIKDKSLEQYRLPPTGQVTVQQSERGSLRTKFSRSRLPLKRQYNDSDLICPSSPSVFSSSATTDVTLHLSPGHMMQRKYALAKDLRSFYKPDIQEVAPEPETFVPSTVGGKTKDMGRSKINRHQSEIKRKSSNFSRVLPGTNRQGRIIAGKQEACKEIASKGKGPGQTTNVPKGLHKSETTTQPRPVFLNIKVSPMTAVAHRPQNFRSSSSSSGLYGKARKALPTHRAPTSPSHSARPSSRQRRVSIEHNVMSKVTHSAMKVKGEKKTGSPKMMKEKGRRDRIPQAVTVKRFEEGKRNDRRPSKETLHQVTSSIHSSQHESIHMVESLMSLHDEQYNVTEEGKNHMSCLLSPPSTDRRGHCGKRDITKSLTGSRELKSNLKMTSKHTESSKTVPGIASSSKFSRESEKMSQAPQAVEAADGSKPAEKYGTRKPSITWELQSATGSTKSGETTQSKWLRKRKCSSSDSTLSFEKFILESKNPIGITQLLCKSGFTTTYEKLASEQPQGPGSVRSRKSRPRSRVFPTLTSFLDFIEREDERRRDLQQGKLEKNQINQEQEERHVSRKRTTQNDSSLPYRQQASINKILRFEDQATANSDAPVGGKYGHAHQNHLGVYKSSDKTPHFGVADLVFYGKSPSNFNPHQATNINIPSPRAVVTNVPRNRNIEAPRAQQWRRRPLTPRQTKEIKGATQMRNPVEPPPKPPKAAKFNVRNWKKNALKNMRKVLDEKVGRCRITNIPKPDTSRPAPSETATSQPEGKAEHEQHTRPEPAKSTTVERGHFQTTTKNSTADAVGFTDFGSAQKKDTMESIKTANVRDSLALTSPKSLYLSNDNVSLTPAITPLVIPDNTDNSQRIGNDHVVQLKDWSEKSTEAFSLSSDDKRTCTESPAEHIPPEPNAYMEEENEKFKTDHSEDVPRMKFYENSNLGKKTISFEQCNDGLALSMTSSDCGQREALTPQDVCAERVDKDLQKAGTAGQHTAPTRSTPVMYDWLTMMPKPAMKLLERPSSPESESLSSITLHKTTKEELQFLLDQIKLCQGRPTCENVERKHCGKSKSSDVFSTQRSSEHLGKDVTDPRRARCRSSSPTCRYPKYLVQTSELLTNAVLSFKDPRDRQIQSNSSADPCLGGEKDSPGKSAVTTTLESSHPSPERPSYTTWYKTTEKKDSKVAWRGTVAFRKRLQYLMEKNQHISNRTNPAGAGAHTTASNTSGGACNSGDSGRKRVRAWTTRSGLNKTSNPAKPTISSLQKRNRQAPKEAGKLMDARGKDVKKQSPLSRRVKFPESGTKMINKKVSVGLFQANSTMGRVKVNGVEQTTLSGQKKERSQQQYKNSSKSCQGFPAKWTDDDLTALSGEQLDHPNSENDIKKAQADADSIFSCGPFSLTNPPPCVSSFSLAASYPWSQRAQTCSAPGTLTQWKPSDDTQLGLDASFSDIVLAERSKASTNKSSEDPVSGTRQEQAWHSKATRTSLFPIKRTRIALKNNEYFVLSDCDSEEMHDHHDTLSVSRELPYRKYQDSSLATDVHTDPSCAMSTSDEVYRDVSGTKGRVLRVKSNLQQVLATIQSRPVIRPRGETVVPDHKEAVSIAQRETTTSGLGVTSQNLDSGVDFGICSPSHLSQKLHVPFANSAVNKDPHPVSPTVLHMDRTANLSPLSLKVNASPAEPEFTDQEPDLSQHRAGKHPLTESNISKHASGKKIPSSARKPMVKKQKLATGSSHAYQNPGFEKTINKTFDGDKIDRLKASSDNDQRVCDKDGCLPHRTVQTSDKEMHELKKIGENAHQKLPAQATGKSKRTRDNSRNFPLKSALKKASTLSPVQESPVPVVDVNKLTEKEGRLDTSSHDCAGCPSSAVKEVQITNSVSQQSPIINAGPKSPGLAQVPSSQQLMPQIPTGQYKDEPTDGRPPDRHRSTSHQGPRAEGSTTQQPKPARYPSRSPPLTNLTEDRTAVQSLSRTNLVHPEDDTDALVKMSVDQDSVLSTHCSIQNCKDFSDKMYTNSVDDQLVTQSKREQSTDVVNQAEPMDTIDGEQSHKKTGNICQTGSPRKESCGTFNLPVDSGKDKAEHVKSESISETLWNVHHDLKTHLSDITPVYSTMANAPIHSRSVGHGGKQISSSLVREDSSAEVNHKKVWSQPQKRTQTLLKPTLRTLDRFNLSTVVGADSGFSVRAPNEKTAFTERELPQYSHVCVEGGSLRLSADVSTAQSSGIDHIAVEDKPAINPGEMGQRERRLDTHSVSVPQSETVNASEIAEDTNNPTSYTCGTEVGIPSNISHDRHYETAYVESYQSNAVESSRKTASIGRTTSESVAGNLPDTQTLLSTDMTTDVTQSVEGHNPLATLGASSRPAMLSLKEAMLLVGKMLISGHDQMPRKGTGSQPILCDAHAEGLQHENALGATAEVSDLNTPIGERIKEISVESSGMRAQTVIPAGENSPIQPSLGKTTTDDLTPRAQTSALTELTNKTAGHVVITETQGVGLDPYSVPDNDKGTERGAATRGQTTESPLPVKNDSLVHRGISNGGYWSNKKVPPSRSRLKKKLDTVKSQNLSVDSETQDATKSKDLGSLSCHQQDSYKVNLIQAVSDHSSRPETKSSKVESSNKRPPESRRRHQTMTWRQDKSKSGPPDRTALCPDNVMDELKKKLELKKSQQSIPMSAKQQNPREVSKACERKEGLSWPRTQRDLHKSKGNIKPKRSEEKAVKERLAESESNQTKINTTENNDWRDRPADSLNTQAASAGPAKNENKTTDEPFDKPEATSSGKKQISQRSCAPAKGEQDKRKGDTKCQVTSMDDLESLLNSELSEAGGPSRTQRLFCNFRDRVQRKGRRARKTQMFASPVSSQQEQLHQYLRENDNTSKPSSSNTSPHSLPSSHEPAMSTLCSSIRQKKATASSRFIRLEDFLLKAENSGLVNATPMTSRAQSKKSSFTSVTHSLKDEEDGLQALLKSEPCSKLNHEKAESTASNTERYRPRNVPTIEEDITMSKAQSASSSKETRQQLRLPSEERGQNEMKLSNKKEAALKEHSKVLETQQATQSTEIHLLPGNESNLTNVLSKPKELCESNTFPPNTSDDDLLKDISLNSSLKISEMAINVSKADDLLQLPRCCTTNPEEQARSGHSQEHGNEDILSNSSSSIVLSWVGSDVLDFEGLDLQETPEFGLREDCETNLRTGKDGMGPMSREKEQPHTSSLSEEGAGEDLEPRVQGITQPLVFSKVWEDENSNSVLLTSGQSRTEHINSVLSSRQGYLFSDCFQNQSSTHGRSHRPSSTSKLSSNSLVDTNHNKTDEPRSLSVPPPRWAIVGENILLENVNTEDAQDGITKNWIEENGHLRELDCPVFVTESKRRQLYSSAAHSMSGQTMDQQAYLNVILQDPRWNPSVSLTSNAGQGQTFISDNVQSTQFENSGQFAWTCQYAGLQTSSTDLPPRACALFQPGSFAHQSCSCSQYSFERRMTGGECSQNTDLPYESEYDCPEDDHFQGILPFNQSTLEDNSHSNPDQFSVCSGPFHVINQRSREDRLDHTVDEGSVEGAEYFDLLNTLEDDISPGHLTNYTTSHAGTARTERVNRAQSANDHQQPSNAIHSGRPWHELSQEQLSKSTSDNNHRHKRRPTFSLDQHLNSRCETNRRTGQEAGESSQPDERTRAESTSSQASLNWYKPQSLPSSASGSNSHSQAMAGHVSSSVSQTDCHYTTSANRPGTSCLAQADANIDDDSLDQPHVFHATAHGHHRRTERVKTPHQTTISRHTRIPTLKRSSNQLAVSGSLAKPKCRCQARSCETIASTRSTHPNTFGSPGGVAPASRRGPNVVPGQSNDQGTATRNSHGRDHPYGQWTNNRPAVQADENRGERSVSRIRATLRLISSQWSQAFRPQPPRRGSFSTRPPHLQHTAPASDARCLLYRGHVTRPSATQLDHPHTGHGLSGASDGSAEHNCSSSAQDQQNNDRSPGTTPVKSSVPVSKIVEMFEKKKV